ncbi:MAG: hypothetical protein ABS948_08015 [Solibacillus sp.]
MKKLVGVFIIIFLAIAAAEIINGLLLTFIYIPTIYSIETVEMANLVKYTISAITVTVALAIVSKVNGVLGV